MSEEKWKSGNKRKTRWRGNIANENQVQDKVIYNVLLFFLLIFFPALRFSWLIRNTFSSQWSDLSDFHLLPHSITSRTNNDALYVKVMRFWCQFILVLVLSLSCALWDWRDEMAMKLRRWNGEAKMPIRQTTLNIHPQFIRGFDEDDRPLLLCLWHETTNAEGLLLRNHRG